MATVRALLTAVLVLLGIAVTSVGFAFAIGWATGLIVAGLLLFVVGVLMGIDTSETS